MAVVALLIGFLIVSTGSTSLAAVRVPATAAAQAAGDQDAQPAKEQTPPEPAFDVDELPISLVRIKRKLEDLPPLEVATDSKLRLDYYIEVYGRYTPIELFSTLDLRSTAVPYGGMTHNDFLTLVTPQEFRSPVVNLSSVAFAATTWVMKKMAERRRADEAARIRRQIEEELRQIRQQRDPD